MSDAVANRRSVLNSFRIEEDFTNRQIYRVVCAASIYMVFVTFLLCVFYTYILNPAQIGKPSLLSFPGDFSEQWQASEQLRGALKVWVVGVMGMTATFAVATGLVLSRKLAGPIHRLKTDLSRMRDGDEVFEITLRDGDELQDVTEILNETLVAIANRGSGIRTEGTEDLAAQERVARLVAMRSHLDELSNATNASDGSGTITTWAARMHDLIDKAEAAGRS